MNDIQKATGFSSTNYILEKFAIQRNCVVAHKMISHFNILKK